MRSVASSVLMRRTAGGVLTSALTSSARYFLAATEPRLWGDDRGGRSDYRNSGRGDGGGDRGGGNYSNRRDDNGGERNYGRRDQDYGGGGGGGRDYGGRSQGGDERPMGGRDYSDRSGGGGFNDRGGGGYSDRGGGGFNDRGGGDRGGGGFNDRGGRNFSDQRRGGGGRGGDNYRGRGDDGGNQRNYYNNDRGGDAGGDRGGNGNGNSYSRGGFRGGRDSSDRGGGMTRQGGDFGGNRGSFSRGGDDHRGGGSSSSSSSPSFRRGGGGGDYVQNSNRDINRAQNRVSDSFRGGSSDEGERGGERSADRMAEYAKEIFDLKRKHRSAHLKKEKASIEENAKTAFSKVRIDMSSQDEKSISMLLNAAVYFSQHPRSFVVKDCVEWSMKNLGALAPQNVALLAHAVTTLDLPREFVARDLKSISDVVVATGLERFAPVELIMLLQAFVKAEEGGIATVNAALQKKMVQHLISKSSACSPAARPDDDASKNSTSLKPREWSTLVDLASKSSCFISKDEALLRDIVTTASLALTAEVIATIHSNNILHFILAFARVDAKISIAVDQWMLLLQRAEGVSKYFFDYQIGLAIECVSLLRSRAMPAELNKDLDALEDGVYQRLEKILKAFDFESTGVLARGLLTTTATTDANHRSRAAFGVLLDRLVNEMAWHRCLLSEVGATTLALAQLKPAVTQESAPKFFHAVIAYVYGERPPRTVDGQPVVVDKQQQQQQQEPFEFDPQRTAEYITKNICHALSIRLGAEMGLGDYRKDKFLCETLPPVFLSAISKCHPEMVISALDVLSKVPKFAGRNLALDNKLKEAAKARLREDESLSDAQREEITARIKALV